MNTIKTPVNAAGKTGSAKVHKAPTVTASSVASPRPKAAPKAKSTDSTAPKIAAKAAAKLPVPAKVEKTVKDKKPKLVRDSFTIPKAEYGLLEELKQRSGKLGHAVKKSEVLRAGIKALAGMTDTHLLSALKEVPAIKTGRPAKG